MSVHSSYLFHIQSVPSVFPVAPLCTDMHSFPSPPAFHCQKAYWLYQEIPILQVYILDCSQLIYCMDLYSRSSVNPLMRALRIDKLSLAVLEGALLDYLWGNPLETVPVQRMLHRSQEALSEQAKQLADGLSACLGDWNIGVEPVMSMAGGGTLPEEPFPSWCVAIQPPGVSTVRLEQYLRTYSTPIIARLQEQKLLVDVRCLSEEDMRVLCQACRDFSEEENSKRGEG